MKKYLVIILMAIVSAGCAQKEPAVRDLDPAAFSEKLKSTADPQLIDVRTIDEYAGQHLANADNIDWNGSEFEAKMAAYDKSKPVFVYCRLGGRSSKAANKLAEMGFTEIYNLKGGITGWNSDPTIKKDQ